MNDDDNINNYIPSIINPRSQRKSKEFSLTQNSVSRCSLSLKRFNRTQVTVATSFSKVNPNKENSPNVCNLDNGAPKANRKILEKRDEAYEYNNSLGFSAIEDLFSCGGSDSLLSPADLESKKIENQASAGENKNVPITEPNTTKADSTLVTVVSDECQKSVISISSATELVAENADTTFEYIGYVDKPNVKLSFEVNDCESVTVNSKNGAIKYFLVSHKDNSTNIDCELIQGSQSTEIETDENMNETSLSPLKRPAVVVDLEIKKQKLTNDVSTENSKVLILNTNAIEKISHVIIQPPNYKFLKRNISHSSKYKKEKLLYNGNSEIGGGKLKQVSIESFFRKGTDATIDVGTQLGLATKNGAEEMSKNSSVYEGLKCDRGKPTRMIRRDANETPKSARLPSKRDITSPKRLDVIKTTNSDAPSPKVRNESSSAHSPRKNVNSLHFNLPVKSKSNKTPLSPKLIPHHKIVAGTHFAVDAFSYGDIPNVKHYFLTHFHSDHYSGLKKGFNKLLFCSKITSDLCISRLGINPKSIHIINVDETIKIDGVEIAAVDANHCPGALMFVFTLPNGKTLLHTGDFRASPAMESYPVFWNKDIHTIYLDTTYCNPRYDFPTQEQSLEMALYILRQKKMALEKVGKKFSSVLIVCGTYTIGKEKFFLGMSRRVGCAVWACPEKERVLQVVEGRAAREPAPACQLHVVPMRDLTHEKLRTYLDSLNGAFSEVVAFKPSGWENGKNSSVEKDLVTIHGIPYSEHSSFSELIRFVKFLKPKQVVPTVDISGGVKAVQKYFPCPLVHKDEPQYQARVTDYFIHSRGQSSAVT